jgi:hypothetical protein
MDRPTRASFLYPAGFGALRGAGLAVPPVLSPGFASELDRAGIAV